MTYSSLPPVRKKAPLWARIIALLVLSLLGWLIIGWLSIHLWSLIF